MNLLDTKVHSIVGDEGFDRLVAAFYRRVATDDILRPMYPEEELLAAQHRLRDFLVQRFGGPMKYSEKRGHPRLRMRHAPFAIDPRGRDRWVELMEAALAECEACGLAFAEDGDWCATGRASSSRCPTTRKGTKPPSGAG